MPLFTPSCRYRLMDLGSQFRRLANFRQGSRMGPSTLRCRWPATLTNRSYVDEYEMSGLSGRMVALCKASSRDARGHVILSQVSMNSVLGSSEFGNCAAHGSPPSD